METKVTPFAGNFNKYAYVVFTVTGIVFLLMKDYSQSAIFTGLALVFDPFNTAVSFDKRPLWQRAWLVVHLLAALAVFALMILKAK
jgi:hypothetical protein